MESLSSKEFFDKLKSNTLKPSFVLKGIVKKSGKDSEVLFTRKGDFTKWVAISSDMIESVNVLKTFTKGNETFIVVKLHLKDPSTPEGKVLYELLSAEGREEKGSDESGWNKHSAGKCSCGSKHHEGEEGHVCPHCGCSHDNHGCTCGCHHENSGQCNCGCHGNCHCNCKCNCGCHHENNGGCKCGCHNGCA